MILPNLPGVVFAYDARQGVKLQPLEPASVGLFDYAVDTVDDISGRSPHLSRRRSGSDPYRAMQVPFNPTSGFNGHVAPAYAPAFDMRADQQSQLEHVNFTDLDFGTEGFNRSFVAVASMRALTVAEGLLMAFCAYGDPAGNQVGYNGAVIFARNAATDAIYTARYPAALYGEPDHRANTHIVSAPITLDTVYRFGVVMTDADITLYLNNAVVGTAPQYTGHPIGRQGKLALGGSPNSFAGHNGQAWDGPIMFAIGANVTWDAAEMAELDAWIVEELNLV